MKDVIKEIVSEPDSDWHVVLYNRHGHQNCWPKMFASANCLLFLVIFYGVQTQGAVKIEFLSLRRFLFFHFPSFCHVQYLFMWCIAENFLISLWCKFYNFIVIGCQLSTPTWNSCHQPKCMFALHFKTCWLRVCILTLNTLGIGPCFFRLKIKYLILNRCIFVP